MSVDDERAPNPFVLGRWVDARQQCRVIAAVCFACPGFFNALQGLGGAGMKSTAAANAANVALYLTFAVAGFFGGSLFNSFGVRRLEVVGSATYSLYAAMAYLAKERDSFEAYLAFVLSGALLGVGAALLWTAQGAVMMSYAAPGERGQYIGEFWLVFNLGGFLGGVLQFFINYSGVQTSSSNGWTYFAFVCVMLTGTVIAAVMIVSPDRVVRSDGVPVMVSPAKTVKREILDTVAVVQDKAMLMLAPLFLGTNFYYTYVFNCVNASMFNARSRGLNSALYWTSQMTGALAIGKLLDQSRFAARTRALQALWLLIVVGTGVYVYGMCVEEYIIAPRRGDISLDLISDPSSSVGIIVLLVAYGLLESVLQAYCYWLLGVLAAGDTSASAKYTGFYKSAQSLGAALGWALDTPSIGISCHGQFWLSWLVFTIGLAPIFLVIKRNLRHGAERSLSNRELNNLE
ncbi:DUF895 domain membrane protein [Perkinsus chesapeaki]|uniref:DUF895 domain membrane protein n=1 Tax=Perkinsus chesapeaki TaxID=330153 RepID=A0A7J6MUV6_PERCH|nr:DUF895 domain membrane protein [Perkinsus chesapeaki]